MVALGVILLVVGGVMWLVGSLMVVVAAFRVDTTWGLLVLFVPFAVLVFLFKYWDEAKRGFLISVAGVIPVLIAVFLLPAALAARGVAQFQESMEQPPTFTTQRQTGGGFDAPASPEPAATPEVLEETTPTPTPIPAARPRPTRAPTPTPFPEDDYAVARAEAHVGERLHVRLDRGDEFVGTLLEVEGEKLKFERRLATGMMTFILPADRILSIEPAD